MTPPAKPVSVKPADMPGLGYLPASTEAVLAVQVPQFLERLGPEAADDPAKALVALGVPQMLAEIIDKATAVGLKNVYQLVVGFAFQNHAFPPEITVVVHTARPFDLEAIAHETKARGLNKNGRHLFVAKAGPVAEVFWCKVDDRVLVATILAKDFDDVPTSPKEGLDHLRRAVASVIRERLADDACVWLVASSDRWDKYLAAYTWLPGTQLQGRTDLIKPAERLQTVAVSVPMESEHPIDVQIGLKSTDAGQEFRASMVERFKDEQVEVSGDGEWVRLQSLNDPANIRSIIGRLMPNAK
jgi:hypothetical protein